MEVKNKTKAVTSCKVVIHMAAIFRLNGAANLKNVLTRDYIKKSIKDCKIKH
jgi:hypothetical protein